MPDRGDRSSTARAARNRLLPAGRVSGPMPWVIAIMMFLTVLAAAAGLALASGMRTLGAQLAGRVTIQIVDADPEARKRSVAALTDRLHKMPGIRSVHRVDDRTLADQLRPWLGADAASADLPIPALIDVETDAAATGAVTQIVGRIAPRARVEPHAAFLGPLSGLVATLTALAALLVLLMAVATGAVVVLAARAAHEAHRGTIEILHQMGATDVQVARLFQRRIALDALFGGALGFLLAAAAILLVGHEFGSTGSELLGTLSLPPPAWAVLVALPLLGVALATVTARMTVVRALARAL
jgi:cell division transport system permease protein